jgi:hypothetical protein
VWLFLIQIVGKQFDSCEGLTTLPSLIDCNALYSLAITRNAHLTSLIDSALQSRSSLVQLAIAENDALLAANVPPMPNEYPKLKMMQVNQVTVECIY